MDLVVVVDAEQVHEDQEGGNEEPAEAEGEKELRSHHEGWNKNVSTKWTANYSYCQMVLLELTRPRSHEVVSRS